MKLPENSIGISDILAYRECPRRMSYGMRRHQGGGQQSDMDMPEALLYGALHARMYGSAIHRAIEATEEGESDAKAAQAAWDEYGRWLDPEDRTRLDEDLEVYHARDFPNTRTVAAEEDWRVPLLVHEGEQIYFRFKVDRLYERVDAPGTFLHIDYKSSSYPKTQKEVHEDLQLWAYNWSIHELLPEVETLLQFHDQLSYGQLPTRKSESQRVEIRAWLEAQVRAILADEDWQPDELLPHSYNEWCPWCPIIADCPVVDDLLDFAKTRISTLMDADMKQLADATPIEDYLDLFEDSKRAASTLEAFQKIVSAVIREGTGEQRAGMGYMLRARANSKFTAGALERIHERLGPQFYEVASVTKKSLEGNLGDDEDTLAWALEQAEKVAGTPSVVKAKT